MKPAPRDECDRIACLAQCRGIGTGQQRGEVHTVLRARAVISRQQLQGDEAATISGSIPDEAKSRSTTAPRTSSPASVSRTVARRPATSCSIAVATRQSCPWRSWTSPSASRSLATRGSVWADTARPPTSAKRRPSPRRSVTMRRSAASARLSDVPAARRWGGPSRHRARPPGASRARRPERLRSHRPWRRDVRGGAARGASIRPARRGRRLSVIASPARPESHQPLISLSAGSRPPPPGGSGRPAASSDTRARRRRATAAPVTGSHRR